MSTATAPSRTTLNPNATPVPDAGNPTPHPLSIPLPQPFVRHINAANQHFQPADEFARLLTLHQARALWGLGRTDANLAVNIDLAMEADWDAIESQFEEADLSVHSVLAAATFAERRASRRRLSEANRHLNRFQLTAKLLQTITPQA